MKTGYIGVLGLGTFSTVHYLTELNSLYNNQFGGYSTCPFKLLNVNFNEINPHLPEGFEVLIPRVRKYIIELNEMGVCTIVIPNITLHLTIDQINFPDEIKSKIIHPFEELIRQLKSSEISEFTLLGTRHTMKSELVKNYFSQQGIQVLIPEENDIKLIDELRTATYEKGTSSKRSDQLLQIAKKYQNPVIFCTELSLLNTSELLDVVSLQIQKAVNVLT